MREQRWRSGCEPVRCEGESTRWALRSGGSLPALGQDLAAVPSFAALVLWDSDKYVHSGHGGKPAPWGIKDLFFLSLLSFLFAFLKIHFIDFLERGGWERRGRNIDVRGNTS